jgi:hypothetical protein
MFLSLLLDTYFERVVVVIVVVTFMVAKLEREREREREREGGREKGLGSGGVCLFFQHKMLFQIQNRGGSYQLKR